MLSTLLAYRPFFDPLPMGSGAWWFTIVPLAFFVALIYKAVRSTQIDSNWAPYCKQVALMTTQIVLTMAGLVVGLHLALSFVVPMFQ